MSRAFAKTPNHALRRAREQRGWSQEQVAAQIGASAFTVHRWEQGITAPSPYYRQKLCALFGLSLEELGVLSEAKGGVSDQPDARYWNVPYHRNPFFTGRKDLLAQISSLFKNSEDTQGRSFVALSGLGGIGKTQLAIEYAYQYEQMYRAVLWVPADSPGLLHEHFGHLARILHLPQQDGQEFRYVIEAVQNWLTEQSSCLLIFDNVEDIKAVYHLVPTAYRGHILLTTRLHTVGALAQHVAVDALTPSEGMAVLLRRAKVIPPGTSPTSARLPDQRVARKLAHLMGGLPLALDQAGAYIEEMTCDLEGYLQRYQTHQVQMLMRRGTSFEYPESVTTTWSLAFERLQQSHPQALRLLQLCAFLHPDSIPEEIFLASAPPLVQPLATDLPSLDELVNVACMFSLVRRHSKTNTLSMHRLVQSVLKERLDEPAQRQMAEWAVRAVNALFPECSFSTWALCHRYLASALAAADLIERWRLIMPEAARLLSQAGMYVQAHAHYAQAEQLFSQAAGIYEQLYGHEHLRVADCLFALASLYEMQWKEDQGESLYRRVLEIRTHLLGPDHPQVAHGFNALAMLFYKRGKYAQASELYQQALRIFERVEESNSLDAAHCLNNLAALYSEQSDYTQAEQLHKRALAIREQALEPDHPDIATSLRNLAATYVARGQYRQAEQLYQRALAIREKVLGPEHPDVSMVLRSLGLLYYLQGKYAEAEPFYQRTLAIRQKAFGPHHGFVGDAFCMMAELQTAQGKYAEAEEGFQKALAIWEPDVGPDNPDVAQCYLGLAAIFVAQEHYAEAAPLCERALAILQQTFGTQHPYVAQVLEVQATILSAQGQDTEAEAIYQQALTIVRHRLGETHPQVAGILSKLAALYLKQRRFPEAEQLYQLALAVYEQTVGLEHPLAVDCKEQLATASVEGI